MKRPDIPFLRPELPPFSSYQRELEAIDKSQIYSNFGPMVKRLEREITENLFDGIGGVTSVANATLGLMLAINAVKKPGAKYALMPSFTFAATPLAAVWCGLVPYFVDIRLGDWALDDRKLRDALDRLRKQVAVVVPYATFGSAMDLSAYAEIHASGTPVVVDAAPAAGCYHRGTHFGSGMPGAVVYSLHATKPFGVGEGGFVYSATPEITEAIRRASNFGFDQDRVSVSIGLNAKMSEYAAAIGLVALRDLGVKTTARRELYDLYLKHLEAADLLRDGWTPHAFSGDGAPQFMSVLCPPGMAGRDVVGELAHYGIEARTYFSPPCNSHPSLAAACSDELPCTEEVCARVVSLPLWAGMSRHDVQRVVQAMRAVGHAHSVSANE